MKRTMSFWGSGRFFCKNRAHRIPLLGDAARVPVGWAGLLLTALLGAAHHEAEGADQLRWRWSNPSPHGNNVIDMAYSAELGLAVQVTERGGLYTSTDLSTWIPRDSGTRKALRAAAFLGRRLVVSGEEGTVLYADRADDIRAGTLADGPTPDWLEGVAASADRSVAVGDYGAIYLTADGVTWERQESGRLEWLRGVAYGAGRFVAVGDDGLILISSDGVEWTKVNSGTTAYLNRVTFTGSAFVVAGDGGIVRISPDGTSWNSQSPNTSKDLLGIGSNASARLVVGDSEVRRYEDGTWHNELSGSGGPPSWLYYSVLGFPERFLIAGQTGLLATGLRTGGDLAWEVESPSARNWLFDLAWVTNLYVAVGDRATVMTSLQGVDWDLEVVPSGLTNAIFLGVGGTTNLLVAVGNQGSLMLSPNTLTNLVWTNDFGNVITQEMSTLGIVWHAVDSPATNDLQGVTFHAGSYYVSGESGLILSSANGTNWVRHPTPSSQLLSGITGFPGGLVATGDEGAMVYSADGEQWSEVDMATSNWLYRVRWLNGTLFTVGQGGVIYTSTNGVDWLLRDSGTTNWLNDITWIDGRYFAAGTLGTLISSPDGLAWSQVGTITAKALFALATDGYNLLAGGIEGVILRSPVVPDLTPVEILGYARTPGPAENSHQNLFLFGGRVDQQFKVEHADALTPGNWVAGPRLEFLDTSGTLFYLETVTSTNAPPMEYFRATLVP